MATNLGDLLKQAGLQQTEPAAAEPTEPKPNDPVRWAPKVVVRVTRKGRGGRTVTLVQGLLAGHDQVSKRLRKHLGVGARVEEPDIAVQGDQAARLSRWLTEQGVRKVVRG